MDTDSKNQNDKDLYLEEILIGTIFLDPDAYVSAVGFVKERDFVNQSARKCWMLIGANFQPDDNTNLQYNVYINLTESKDKEWCLSCSSNIISSSSTIQNTAKQIAELAKRRRILTETRLLTDKAQKENHPSDWMLQDLSAIYTKEAGSVDEDSSIKAVVERFKTIQSENKKIGRLGLHTGFKFFNDDYLVYQPGHLWVIGAWTSVGKSAYMIEAVNRFFDENEDKVAAIFSTEMTEEQNVARLVANKTGINAKVILSGNMLDNHKLITDAAIDQISENNLYIYDSLRNVADIATQCKKLKHSTGIDVVYVDFIQNVIKKGLKDQYTMMSELAKDFQALALELRCTIVLLSQIPTGAAKEDAGILEFKGAGEIAAACDVGVFMKRAVDDKKCLLFDVRKNRHGKCQKYLLMFNESYTGMDEKGVVQD